MNEKTKQAQGPEQMPDSLSWMNEEITAEEAKAFITFTEKITQIKNSQGFSAYNEDGTLTDSYKNAINELSPYFDAVIHLLHLVFKEKGVFQNPVDMISGFVDYCIRADGPEAQSAGNTELQLSLFDDVNMENLLKAEALNALPRLQSLIPQKHIIPNNKLANSFRKLIDAGEIDLKVSGKNEPLLLSRCALSYNGPNITLMSKNPFTEYDRNVADSVATLYEYGDPSHFITPAQVYRAMIHATKTETPSKQQLSSVTKSLDKLRFVNVRVNCGDELKRRKAVLEGQEVTDGEIEDYLLNLQKTVIRSGGKQVIAYKIMSKPIIYAYSQAVRQVLTFPAKLLSIEDENGTRLANSERRISIKSYLLRRIYQMKGKSAGTQSKHILYTDLYEHVCEKEPSEKVARLIREYVDDALQYWIRQKLIAGYDYMKSGKREIGIEIRL